MVAFGANRFGRQCSTIYSPVVCLLPFTRTAMEPGEQLQKGTFVFCLMGGVYIFFTPANKNCNKKTKG
jgi:hypothetical protein